MLFAAPLELSRELMTKTFTFPGCWVHINVETGFLETVFSDGRSLTSIPMPEKDMATAREYGYGDDWLRLWREHDLLHHWIGVLFGQPYSPTIWSECHEDHPAALPRWARQQEEEFVAHVHRWLNQDIWVEELWPLAQFDIEEDELKAQARGVLEHKINVIAARNS